jgi:hypothetical protein
VRAGCSPITGDILPLTVYDLWKEVHLGVELGVRVYQRE